MCPVNIRSLPGAFILENKSANGTVKFEDVTASVAPDLLKAGMVTAAFCTDVDNDHWTDLVVAGEWMPLCIYRNHKGKFEKNRFGGNKRLVVQPEWR